MVYTEDIDPAYAVRDVVNSTIPSKWLRKKKALEAVYRSLLRYFQNHCEYNPTELEEPVELDSIAEHDDAQQTIQVATYSKIKLEAALTNICVQLVTLFLMAAVSGPSLQKYALKMENELDDTTRTKIKEMFQQKVC
jgi:hypothetical protein